VQIAIVLGMLFVAIAAGLPVAFALLLTSIVSLLVFQGGVDSLVAVGQVMYTSVFSYHLIAIPLFILMGGVMNATGAAKSLFDLANAWLRHLPGGLALAAVAACAMFAAICGSSTATAATIGLVSLGEMRRRGYPPPLAVGTIASAGTLGILIPPSIPLLLFALVTDESPGDLFMAGVIPGVISALVYMIYISASVGITRSVPKLPPMGWRERGRVTIRSIWAVSAIPLVLGGIYTGWFTTTEAAAVGLGYAIFLGFAVSRTLTLCLLFKTTIESAVPIAMILLILAAATLFGHVATRMGLPGLVVDLVVGSGLSKWEFLLVYSLVVTIMGCFLDPTSILLITVPLIYPALAPLDIHPIWFAIVLVKNLELANITPPFGFNLFVMRSIATDLSMGTIVRGVLPFILLDVGLILLLIAIPDLSLWLPTYMQSR